MNVPASGTKPAVAVLLLGLVARLVMVFYWIPAWEITENVVPTPDLYPVLASSLLERGTLGFEPVGVGPTTARGPAFPVWLAAGILMAGDNARWLGLWSSLPGLLAAVWVALALARRYGGWAAFVGGSIAACHPLPVAVAARAMSDEFFAAVGWAALATLVGMAKARGPVAGWGRAVVSGLLFGVLMLTRANGLLFLVAGLGVVLLWTQNRRKVVVLVLIALTGPLLWSVRTSRLEQRPVFVHSLLWYNFWNGEAAARLGPERVRGEHHEARRELIAGAAGLPELADPHFWYIQLDPPRLAEVERRLQAAAFEHIRESPGRYAWRCIRGAGDFWFRAETMTRTWQYVLAVFPVLALAVVGIGRCWRRDPDDLLGRALLAAAMLQVLLGILVFPMARFSVQIYPALSYAAGAGAAWIAGRLALARSRPHRT